jgi:hypothetical protein
MADRLLASGQQPIYPQNRRCSDRTALGPARAGRATATRAAWSPGDAATPGCASAPGAADASPVSRQGRHRLHMISVHTCKPC